MFSYTGRILARYALNEVAGSVVHRGEAVVSDVLTIRQELQLDEIIDHSVSWALTFGREPRETSPTHPVPGVYLENVAACDGERESISVAGTRTSAVGRGVFSSAARRATTASRPPRARTALAPVQAKFRLPSRAGRWRPPPRVASRPAPQRRGRGASCGSRRRYLCRMCGCAIGGGGYRPIGER